MRMILHTVDINAPVSKAFSAVATEEGLAGWWSREVEAESRVGGLIRFTFIPVFNPEMKITILEEGRLIEWTCVGGHDPWIDNTFRFEFESREAGCVLFFRQEYAAELNDEEYGRYNFNWGYYLNSLKKLCETGQGTPADPESLGSKS